jgi:hypothetical protein
MLNKEMHIYIYICIDIYTQKSRQFVYCFKVQKRLPKLSTIPRARPIVKHGSSTN